MEKFDYKPKTVCQFCYSLLSKGEGPVYRFQYEGQSSDFYNMYVHKSCLSMALEHFHGVLRVSDAMSGFTIKEKFAEEQKQVAGGMEEGA